jgi:hypothetical protein
MPFTPVHFGPGAAIKAVIPARFSFTIFCYAQAVTDLEPAYYMLRGQYPVHRFFHTYLGAALVGAFCALTGRPLCEYFLRLWPSPVLSPLNEFFSGPARIPWGIAFLTAFIGTFSHVFLDSVMHPDVTPLRPFTTANPMLHVVSVGLLHLVCLALGAVGGFVLSRRKGL